MLKRLLLTAVLLSSTYGADVSYIDPDFSWLSTVTDRWSATSTIVIVGTDTPQQATLHRLSKSDASTMLSSNDPNELANSIDKCIEDIELNINLLYITLTSDIANRKPDQPNYPKFLAQLFWGRISILEQILEKLLALPEIVNDSESYALNNKFYDKLSAFSKMHDHADTTVFIKGQHTKQQQLIAKFRETYITQ